MPPEELCIGGLIFIYYQAVRKFPYRFSLVRDSVCGGVFPLPVLPLVAVASLRSGSPPVFRQLQGPGNGFIYHGSPGRSAPCPLGSRGRSLFPPPHLAYPVPVELVLMLTDTVSSRVQVSCTMSGVRQNKGVGKIPRLRNGRAEQRYCCGSDGSGGFPLSNRHKLRILPLLAKTVRVKKRIRSILTADFPRRLFDLSTGFTTPVWVSFSTA